MNDGDQTAIGSRPVLYSSPDGQPDLGPGASERERLLSSLPYLARRLTNADYGALTIINHAGRVEQMYTSGISQEDVDRIGAPPAGHGVLGLLIPENDPVRLHDVRAHSVFAGFPAGHPELKALLGVGVENDGRHSANLYLANGPDGKEFTDNDVEMVQAIAGLAATALENERLFREEESLRRSAVESKTWLEAVIRQASVGILVARSDTGEVLVSSPEASRILGIPLFPEAMPAEYESRVNWYRPNGTRLAAADLPLSVSRRTGMPAGPVEIICERPDGRRIPTLVSAAPVPEGGALDGAAITVIQDVSRLKELDQVKSDFLSMITHDLRSPLATIKALTAEVLARIDEGGEIRADVEAIDEEIEHTTELVSNLLDMSRIEAGSYPLDREVAHLVDIVGDALRRALRSQLGSGRDIRLDVPADLPPVYADPVQIGRVLDNLISNALKYSRGIVTVTSRRAADGEILRTEVSDSGVGILEDDSRVVFDKFFRVTGGAEARWGAGLGLAICKAIVEAHGGTIGVISRPGEGSTFSFTIPLHAEKEGGAP